MRLYILVALGVFLYVTTSAAHAAGFTDGYSVSHGDINGDGKRDLFVKAPKPRFALIPLGDLAIPIRISPPSFLLQNNGVGSFTVIPQLTSAQLDVVGQWPQADIGVSHRDVDMDGLQDLEIAGVDPLIPATFDQVVYARGGGSLPTELTPMSTEFQRYHEQLFGWLIDNEYFNKNAPLTISSSEPSQRRWYSSIGDSTNVFLMTLNLADCKTENPNSVCAISRAAPPPPCVRNVIVNDDVGNPIGPETVDICRQPVHVIIYTPGQVTVTPDFSVFNSDARESSDILKRLRANCTQFGSQDEADLERMLRKIYKRNIESGTVLRSDTNNNFSHPPFPGDDLFDRSDTTFHHYDVLTKICDIGQPNCTMAVVRDNAFRFFTYPSKRLTPSLTQIPGARVLVYITAPGLTEKPGAYVIPGGFVTQRFIQSAPYAGGIQNVTDATHVVFPGTISRYIQTKDNALHVFTHGVGLNRAFCSPVASRPVQVLLGMLNDVYGAKTFRQLDREFIKSLKRSFGL